MLKRAIELMAVKYNIAKQIDVNSASLQSDIEQPLNQLRQLNEQILLSCPLVALFDSEWEWLRIAIMGYVSVRGFCFNFIGEPPTAVFLLSQNGTLERLMAGELSTSEENLTELIDKLDKFLTPAKLDVCRYECINEANADFWRTLKGKKPLSSWLSNKTGYDLWVTLSHDAYGLGQLHVSCSPVLDATRISFADEKHQTQGYVLLQSELVRLYARHSNCQLKELLESIRIPHFLVTKDKRLRGTAEIARSLMECEMECVSTDSFRSEISARLHLPRVLIAEDTVTLVPIVEMPERLSHEEEIALFSQFRQMAWQQAHKYFQKSKEFHAIHDPFITEETKQVAEYALWKAVRSFAPRRGFQFSTFAHKVIVSQVVHFLKSETKFHRGVDTDETTDKDREIDDFDVIENPNAGVFVDEYELRESLRRLPLAVTYGMESFKKDSRFKFSEFLTAIGISREYLKSAFKNP